MSHERDLSISITGSEGEKITWRPRTPLPPESHFHSSPHIVQISAEPSLSCVPTAQTRKFTFFQRLTQRLKMIFKTKTKIKHRGVRVVSTGNNPNDPTTTPKPPTMLHRIKNLWTHTQESKREYSPSPLSSRSGPISRGRRLSKTESWRRSHSITFYDPSPQRFRDVEEPVDISPIFNPKQEGGVRGISYSPVDGVSAPRLQKLSDEVDDMMVLSVTRSPAMTPVFIDDVPPACNTSDN